VRLLQHTTGRKICIGCELERERLQVEAERLERPDDYNVFEENQIALDHEGYDDE